MHFEGVFGTYCSSMPIEQIRHNDSYKFLVLASISKMAALQGNANVLKFVYRFKAYWEIIIIYGPV